jgi:ABC-type branched-subunit amino acid transport system substrate-binding protein
MPEDRSCSTRRSTKGFEYAPCCIYSGAAPNQNARWLADYLTETHGNRYFFVGSNYVYPYESNRIMRDLLSNRGGQVVDEVYIPLDPSDDDIARVIDMVRHAGPGRGLLDEWWVTARSVSTKPTTGRASTARCAPSPR